MQAGHTSRGVGSLRDGGARGCVGGATARHGELVPCPCRHALTSRCDLCRCACMIITQMVFHAWPKHANPQPAK